MLEIVADDDLAPGRIVARRYRLDRVVGEGGMGIVWAATHVLTEKPCALKFLKAQRATDPRSHRRLLDEARAACRVRHPNVAQVHDILELPNGVPFIVMDLLEGEPLSARLARTGAMRVHEAIGVLLQTASAVAAAHELGIVHRDLKPDNIFLERREDGPSIKVLDFGIAKRLEAPPEPASADDAAADAKASSRGQTTTHSLLGTPSYMAPEQLARDARITPAADVFALGIIAVECITGSRPARDETTSDVDRAAAAASIERAGAPRALAAVVVRLLASAPDERAPLADLEQVVRDLRAPPAATARSARPRWSPTSTFVLAGGGAVAAIVIGLGASRSVDAAKPVAAPTATTTTTAAVAPPSVQESAAAPPPPTVVASTTPSASPPPATARPHRRPTPPSPSTTSSTAPEPSHAIPSYQRR